MSLRRSAAAAICAGNSGNFKFFPVEKIFTMGDSVGDKIRGFLFSPTLAFRRAKDEHPGKTMTYMVVLAVFYSVMSTLLTILEIFIHPFAELSLIEPGPAEPLVIASWLLRILVLTLALAAVFGLVLHVFVYLAGGRNGVWQTEKSVFYSLTPMFVLGWIPVIGFTVGGIWSLVLGIIGIRELHGLGDTKAAIAMILALVLFAAIAVLTCGDLLLVVASRIQITA